MGWLVVVMFWSLACAMAAQYVAWQKGRPMAEGFVLGIVLGPIGALVVALLPDEVLAEARQDRPSPPPPHPNGPVRAVAPSDSVEVTVDPSTWR
jgi:uncharacterized membrane protein YeaQ/YmgE (transglycosylase-associated protein family)